MQQKGALKDVMSVHHLTTGASYGAAVVSFLAGLLNRFTPDQWSDMGVLGGLLLAVITMLVNIWFRHRNARAWQDYLRRQEKRNIPCPPEE